MNNILVKSLFYLLLVPFVFAACKNDDVSDIELTETSKDLMVGDTLKLAAVIKAPEDRDFPTAWFSSNEDAVVVSDNGVVVAKAAGSAVITARAGKKEAECAISVFDYIFNSASVSTTGDAGMPAAARLSLAYRRPVATGLNKKTSAPGPDVLCVFDIALPQNITKLGRGVYKDSEGREDYTFLPGSILPDTITGSYILSNTAAPALITSGLFDVLEVDNNYFIIGKITTNKEEDIRFQYQGTVKNNL